MHPRGGGSKPQPFSHFQIAGHSRLQVTVRVRIDAFQPLSSGKRILPVRLQLFLATLAALTLAGCRPSPPPPKTSAPSSAEAADASGTRSYPMRGKVVAIHGSDVTLDHQAVPGFMDAMTMSYKLKDPSIVSELHPGDRITATLLVHKDVDGFNNELLDSIVIIAQAKPDYKPAVQYHVPTPGDTVPNFAFRNQSDRTIHLNQFRGRAVLMTFIYTRCQLADFCPRMSHNFADINNALSSDPKLYNATHLLSISFDPAYDTPQVLRSYGGSYTGRFTKETFGHWDFAAPPAAELAPLTQYFDVGVTPGDAKSLTHSLSTVLIGKDGKVVAWYPTNDWQTSDVLSKLKAAATA